MPPSPYLLWVNSKPTKASEDLFVKWYTTEHVPDLVSSGAATRATFYRETLDFPGSSREHHERQWLSVDQQPQERLHYLAAYQTDFAEALKSKDYLKIPVESDLFPWKLHSESGTFDARNYELIQDYDPDHVGEGKISRVILKILQAPDHLHLRTVPPKYIVTVEVEPTNEADYDAWYREEHLDALHSIPVYRRSQRYKLGPLVPNVTRGQPPRYVAIHEVDDIKEFFEGPDFDAAWSEWTKKQVADAKAFVVRAWEKIMATGFDQDWCEVQTNV
jgi:hypothetical protein